MTLLYEEHLPGGGLWSAVIRRHSVLRLTDLEGGVNAGLMMWNFAQPSDRLNLLDTLKAQYTAKLTRGHILMSDMGRALASIITDTVGWHDPLGGHANAADTLAKYGAKTYQEALNDWHRNAHDNFLVEAGKHGLSPRDLHANVNFFSRLDADEEGGLAFHPDHSTAGSLVELRAEMDLLVVITTCQHPMDPEPAYAPKPLLLTLLQGGPPAADDFCRTFRRENARSLALTERFLALPSSDP
ncbi:MAG: urea carboxylase-associated family protein [Verrucomicrobiaceae bacterium]|nr:MAG: urea carboxylase-associated family protein [Verrucomicrobiaceae bacterium]